MTCALDAICSYMTHANGKHIPFQDLHEKARNFVRTTQHPHDPRVNVEGWYNIDVISHLCSGMSQRVQKAWNRQAFENAPSSHSIRSDGSNHWVYIDLQTRMIHEGPRRQRLLVEADLVKYYRGVWVSSNAPRHADPVDMLSTAIELSRQEELARQAEASLLAATLLESEYLAVDEQIEKDHRFAIKMSAG